MSAAYPAVSEVVPHAGRMILLDRIVDFSDNAVACIATIRADNPYLSERGEIGEWVALEYMSQAIAAHSGLEGLMRGEPPRVGLLLGSRKFTCCSPGRLRLGQTLLVSAQRVWQDEGMAICQASVSDESSGAKLIEASLSVYLPESEQILEGMKSYDKNNIGNRS